MWKSDIKMGICSKYNILKQPYESQNYMIDIYTKMQADSNAIKSADFKYLLFN